MIKLQANNCHVFRANFLPEEASKCAEDHLTSTQIFQQPPKTSMSKTKIRNSLYPQDMLSVFLYFWLNHPTIVQPSRAKKLKIKLTSIDFYLVPYIN